MFRFRYANLLKYKCDMEQQAKNDLALAVVALTAAKDQLKQLNRDRIAHSRREQQAIQEGVSASSFRLQQVHAAFFDSEITSAQQNVEKAEQRVKSCRQQLLDATQEKKKYEKLRESELRAYTEAENKAEAELNDQLVTYKSSRLGKGELS